MPTIKTTLTPIGLMGSPMPESAHLHEERVLDSQGRTLEHRKYGPDGKLGEETITCYDAQGRPLEETARFDDGETEEHRTYEYDDAARTQTETVLYSGEAGERIVAWLDEHGHSMREVMYDPDGEMEFTILFAYHKPGLVSSEDHLDYEEQPIKRIRTAYDELDRPVKVAVESDDDADPTRAEVYTYGHLEETIVRYDADGREIQKQTRTLNERGDTERIVLEDNGTTLQVQQFTYDGKGRPVQVEWLNGDGHLVRRQTFGYNEAGQLIEESMFERNLYTGRANHYQLRHEISD